MKKILRSLSLALVVALCLLAATACDVTKSTDEAFFTFTLDELSDTYVVSASSQEMPDTVIIPATYNGKSVTAIAENGFNGKNCNAIKDVVIKGDKITVGAHAFDGLNNLRSVEFHSTIINVGAFAFENCAKLKELIFPQYVSDFVAGAFSFMGTAIEELTVNTEYICFLEEYSFAECKALKAVNLVSLNQYDATAFNGCSALQAINVQKGTFKTVDGNLYNAAGDTLVKYAPAGSATAFVVTVANVGENAFRDAANLETVTLSSAVTSVGAYAFADSGVQLIVLNGNDYSAFSEEWLFGTNANVQA